MASSGSKAREASFLYPGVLVANAAVVGGGVAVGSGVDSSFLASSLGFVTNVLPAKASTSWKTPSLRNAGAYSVGTFESNISASWRAPKTRVGWSFDERIEEEKLATGTNLQQMG